MRIGGHEVAGEAESSLNSAVCGLLGRSVRVTGGTAMYSSMSASEHRHYRLEVDDGGIVGIKLPYERGLSHAAELIVHGTRDILGMPGYAVRRVRGLPFDGRMWRGGDCLMTSWGRRGDRTDLEDLDRSCLGGGDMRAVLGDLAANTVLALCLGLWDRKPSNFVWDRTIRRVISIDHERLVGGYRGLETLSEMYGILKYCFGRDWNDDEKVAGRYRAEFASSWSLMEGNLGEVGRIIREHGESDRQLHSVVEMGPDVLLDSILKMRGGS